MVCEGNDDIEIMSNEYHVFIQVKSSKIDKADILKILDRFCAYDENEKESLIIDRLHIDKRPLFRDVEDTRAIFARYLRKAYGFRDQGEHRIDILFNILCEKFAELRRNRDNISRAELEKILGKELCKASWHNIVGKAMPSMWSSYDCEYLWNERYCMS